MSQLTEKQRRALCRLYRTLSDLEDEDAGAPSDAAEVKARAAMESVGLVIDLPPAGGTPRSLSRAAASPPPLSSSSSAAALDDMTREEAAALAVASAAESVIDATFGGDGRVSAGGEGGGGGEGQEGEGEEEGRKGEQWWAEEEEEEEWEEQERRRRAAAAAERSPPLSQVPLTYVMLLRGLFDTQREGAVALVGGGGGELLKGMAVRRLPQSIAPVLRMVASLRGVCAHLVSFCRGEWVEGGKEGGSAACHLAGAFISVGAYDLCSFY